MKSITSCCNKAIIKSNMKRYGFIAVLYAVLNLLIGIITIVGNLTPRYNPTIPMKDSLEFIIVTPWDMFMAFLLPGIMAIVLFRYIQDEKSLSAIHAFPVSRKSLFASQFISFELIYSMPVVLNCVIAGTVLMAKGYPVLPVCGYMLQGMLLMLVVGTAVFGMTAFFGMLVGSSVLQAGITLLLMGAPFLIVGSIRGILGWTLKGYPSVFNDRSWDYYATPYYSFVMTLSPVGCDIKIFAGAVTVLLMAASLGLAYILYQKRSLERHTDLIAFDMAKKVFLGLLTVMSALGFAIVIGEVTVDSSIGAFAGLISGSLLGYSVTKMIAEKEINVIKYYKQALGITLILVLALMAVDLDAFGYEGRVPETEDIAYVLYSEHAYLSYTDMNKDVPPVGIHNHDVFNFEKPDTIELIRKLHKRCIEGAPPSENSRSVNLVYILKNGRRVHRIYDEGDVALMEQLHESTEYRHDFVDYFAALIYDSDKSEVLYRGYNERSELVQDEDLQSLLEAYREDYTNMTYGEELLVNGIGYFDVQVTEYERQRDGSTEEWYYTYQFFIRPSFSNTIAWLEAHDMGHLLPSREGIEEVFIRKTGSFYEGYHDDSDKSDYYYSERMAVPSKDGYYNHDGHDPLSEEQIDAMYAMENDLTRFDQESYIVHFYYKNGGSYTIRVVDLPADIKALLDDSI